MCKLHHAQNEGAVKHKGNFMKYTTLMVAIAVSSMATSAAATGYLSLGCEMLDTDYYFCEAHADGYSDPQPFKFYWTVHGSGPSLGSTHGGVYSFRTVVCNQNPPTHPWIEVEVRDDNGVYMDETSTISPCA
jgi:hypothetical protein